MKYFDIAILGSGASGCMCAMIAANTGKKIALIDKNKLPAKKLMATGNGRCNITNLNKNFDNCYNQNLETYFTNFNNIDAYNFFQELGLILYNDDEGRVYPLSNSAKSVVDVINNNLKKYRNISLFNEKSIEKIEKIGETFEISLNDDKIIAKK